MAGKSLNKVMLIGNLGKDPELRYTANGTPVASFSIATSDSWKDLEGNLTERTEWHNIVAWRKLAEICGEWLKKGQKVYIEGSIRNRSYDDKNGVKRYVTEIIADDLIMLGGGKGVVDTDPDKIGTKSIQATSPNAEEKEDDLPF
ncbi:MAG: single-stranded DNA-binding protein [Bacteroidota bacterium]|nr:single-stranded DNA-binding protein [Bacteroidota bacterium]